MVRRRPWVIRAGGVVDERRQPAVLDRGGELVVTDRVPDAGQPVSYEQARPPLQPSTDS